MNSIPTIEIQVDIGDGWLVVSRMDSTDIDCWCSIDAITENAEVPVRVVEQYGEREEYDTIDEFVEAKHDGD